MADLSWWIVQLDDSGRVLTCMRVEQPREAGRSWIYVRAADEKEAGRRAFNEYCKARQNAHRLRLRAEGKCEWCGRKNDRPAGKRCTLCLKRDNGYGKRARDKAAGRPVPKLERAVAVAARREEDRQEVVKAAVPSLRLSVLLEVQAAWAASSTNGAFTRWLSEQISTARGARKGAA